MVSEMLELVWDSYHFDLRGDLELRMNLARHIVLPRFASSIAFIDNPLLADIKERFTLAYSMALDSSTILAQKYGNRLSDDEVGYIALASSSLSSARRARPCARTSSSCARAGRGAPSCLSTGIVRSSARWSTGW
ncbi:MAG: PRD domain-containing protein [Collinsella sp.]